MGIVEQLIEMDLINPVQNLDRYSLLLGYKTKYETKQIYSIYGVELC